MSTRILDGTAIAAEIKAELKSQVEALGYTPGLTVILIGEDPASAIYVRNKVKACEELGIRSVEIRPETTITTEELLAMIDELNEDDSVDGILVQLPLPKHVDTKKVLDAVAPEKDVDGFHPVNVGRLSTGQDSLTPCTPTGVIEILKRSGIATEGAEAVVIGRSDIVGKPVAMMLTAANATVTICHGRTKNLAEHTRRADILVVAIGKAGFVTADMVKPGAVLIDVGINRVSDAAEVNRFFGDDAKRMETYAKRGSVVMGDIAPQAFAVSSAYTPVPGGVGALTIAMLMHNTVKAAKLRRAAK
ncbi:bifunctional methylenetetrahydrofolate dehydrogenase/methenyltetrahydrofolate cyclohydrolase FolD [Terriglobus roseus]|uniref:Bifunctional protein FolD n=1 Tax=Terriglobus roseus TaxID=392734 RepID=A0A1G7G708_9BACT|nr:bifunctional methylenetetrahydrofolate dehydrogenase/methenyltetrahydrofolate cyclohydrolase FolD [Terriglobus roseus]SDE83819.1 methenyltetrahydrofolate cyclohydrolase /5,10-methylenetetrahydrofolate dehydrogenase (NADP+) [Terriglobus roseus]